MARLLDDLKGLTLIVEIDNHMITSVKVAPPCALCGSSNGHTLSCVKITKDYIDHEAAPPRQIDGKRS
jgi:hypothetical protein